MNRMRAKMIMLAAVGAAAAVLWWIAQPSGDREPDGSADAPQRPAATSPTAPARGAGPPMTVASGPRRVAGLLEDLWTGYIADGSWPRAVGRYGRSALAAALAEAAADPRTHLSAGDRALACGQANLAVDCFARAVALRPEDPDALRAQAIALVVAERFGEAVTVYRRILELDPKDRKAKFNLAVTLSRLRKFDDSERVYLELLAADPEHLQARYNLASLYHARGRLALAAVAWRDITARAPHLVSAHSALAEVLTDLGENAQAMRAYAEAAKRAPADPINWINLCASARSAGSYGRALAAIRRAAEIVPQDAGIQKRMGDLLVEIHRATSRRQLLVDAVAAYRGSLQLNGEQPDLRRRLAGHEKTLRLTAGGEEKDASATGQ